jgi:hypothetical protein
MRDERSARSRAPAGRRGLLIGLLIGMLAWGMAAGCSRDFDAPPRPEFTLVNGSVVDEFDAPVPDARVRLLECGLSALTDAEGQFQILEVPNGDYSLRIDAVVLVDGQPRSLVYQPAEREPMRGAVRDLPPLLVERTARVTGAVTSSDASPVRGAVVYVQDGQRIAAVGDDGSFTLERVPAGTRSLAAARPGYQTQQGDGPLQLTLAPGETREVTLTLEPIPADARASLSGTVLLGNPGPERGVSVRLIERFSSVRYGTVSDDRGRFALSDIPAGFYELRVSHPGYRSLGLSNLTLRDGDALELAVPLVLPPEDAAQPEYPWDGDPSGNPDDDGDGIADGRDNCPVVPNPDQADADGDGIGDACDADYPFDPLDPDGDGVANDRDNCPDVYNPDQRNSDDDPLGDDCDPDSDDDGLPDPQDPDNPEPDEDSCPLLPDPSNDPTLCHWPARLVVGRQDADSGDIQLVSIKANPGDFQQEAYDTGPGQAWGAAGPTRNGWLLYHYRSNRDAFFRLCAIAATPPGGQPICWRDWEWPDGVQQADVMHPSVCVDERSGAEWLFYERLTPRGWRIYATVLDPEDIGATGPGQELLLAGGGADLPPAPERFYNLRDPSCHASGQGLELAYAADFADQTSGPDPRLDWNALVAGVFEGAASGAYPVSNDPDSHERRPVWAGDTWLLDRATEGRSAVARTDLEGYLAVLVEDGSRNQAPAGLSLPGGKRLVAFQSDRGGSFDVYLYSSSSGTAVRLTDTAGWAGSPAWITAP